MSQPRDILDQLLSGYLDDALSDDERVRFEQQMREDDSVAQELEQLREQRDTLRQIHRHDQRTKLDATFADRVLKAAVDQATTEGLSEEHPVMMLAQQPSTGTIDRSLPWARIAGLVLAIAASTIVAVVFFRGPEQAPGELPIANLSQPAASDPDSTKIDVDPDARQIDSGPRLVEVDPPAEGNPSVPEPNTTDNVAQTPADPSSVAADGVPTDSEMTPEKMPTLNADLLGLVMVLNVRQTDPDAVAKAMKAAGLKATDKKQIDQQIVGFDAKRTASDEVSVLYIGSTAKKIDNFVNLVYLDLKGIDSVGFGFVPSAPVAKVGNKIDPNKVRHVSWELKDEGDDAVQVLASKLQELVDLEVGPKQRTARRVAPPNDKGGDFPAQIFVLVH